MIIIILGLPLMNVRFGDDISMNPPILGNSIILSPTVDRQVDR